MRNSFFFVIVLLFVTQLYSEEIIVRMENPSKKEIEYFSTAEYDIAASKVGVFIDLVIDEKNFDSLSNVFNLIIIDRESSMRNRINAEEKKRADIYIDYESFVKEIENLADENPSIVSVTDIGNSIGKNQNTQNFSHDIWLIKVSDNVTENEEEPNYLFVGEHHAREIQTLPVVRAILSYYVKNYQKDSLVTEFVNNNQIYFIPLANPNGYTVARTSNSMWRKNINKNGMSSVSFQSGSYTGVDLNRNYKFHYGMGSTSSQKTSDTYMGPFPMSEPEIIAIDSFISENSIIAAITFHSYSEAILVPYASGNNTPPDNKELRSLAEELSTVMKKKNGGYYDVGTASEVIGYSAGGGMSDHMYTNYGVFCYCFELATEFATPSSEVPKLQQMGIEASKILIGRGYSKLLRGKITNDGKPVRAKIEISGIDDNPNERKPYYSSEKNGLYNRLLPSGKYTARFTLDDGSDSKTISGIEISSDSVTILNVAFGDTTPPDTLLFVTPKEGDTIFTHKNLSIKWKSNINNPIFLSLVTHDNAISKITETKESSFDWRIPDTLSTGKYLLIIESKTISDTVNLYIEQTPTYKLTVKGCGGSGLYYAYDTITITADSNDSTLVFNKWKINDKSIKVLTPSDSPSVTIIMPPKACSIEAVFNKVGVKKLELKLAKICLLKLKKDKILISTAGLKKLKLELFSIQGRRIFSKVCTNINGITTIPLQKRLSDGTYLVKLDFGHLKFTKKVIVN